MKKKISPSMMCAPIYRLEEILSTFEMEKIDMLHIDIMDGVLVPNLALSEEICKQYRKYDIPLDYHLMITDPLNKIDWFNLQKGDSMAIHYESTNQLKECLQMIRSKGAKAGVAINPNTLIDVLIPYFDDIDYVLVMCVYPGFAGQKLVEGSFEKIKAMRELLDSHHRENIEIEVDGNVSFTNAEIMSKNGANIFVAGTSSVFKKDMDLKTAIENLRSVL